MTTRDSGEGDSDAERTRIGLASWPAAGDPDATVVNTRTMPTAPPPARSGDSPPPARDDEKTRPLRRDDATRPVRRDDATRPVRRHDATRPIKAPPMPDDGATRLEAVDFGGAPVPIATEPSKPPAPQAAHVPVPPLNNSPGALALPAGFVLHEYRIDSVLGQGGFGITYLATDVNLNQRVAIKEYLPEEIAFRKSGQTVSAHSSRHRDRYKSGLDSFLVEGRTLASFRHPNIVRVARFFEAHQTAYMVLEYERGAPLKTWWPKHADMAEKDLAALLQPLLDGLAVVHAAGFLHRDIKPDNIQVRKDDGSLVLLDFGSARQAVGAGATVGEGSADVAVTPGYAPIEQYQDGEQGPWTDIYALGATLYWMLGGGKPVDAMDRLMAGPGKDPLRPIAEVVEQRGLAGRYSKSFLDAIDWALRLQPEARPRDVESWRAKLFSAHAASLGLQEALRAGEIAAHPIDTSRRIGRRLLNALQIVVRPGGWPLALKLSLVMALAALLPMVITGYVNLKSSVATVSAAELANLELLARSTAGRMAQLISDSQHLAKAFATDGDFVDYLVGATAGQDKDNIRARLESLAASNPDIHLVMLMDARGTAVLSSDKDVTGKNFAFREYFKAAMRGQPHRTGMVVGAVAGQAGMFFSYPVVGGPADEPIGAVVLRIRGSSFDTILKDVRHGERLTPFMVDGDGVLIAHPDAKQLYKSLVPLPAAKLAEIRADQRFRRDRIDSLDMPELAKGLLAAREQGHVEYRSTITKQAEVAGFAPVQGNDFVVGVSESRAAFEAPLNALFHRLLISVGLVGLLFVGLALWIARRIVRPIKELTGAVDALKTGDYARATVKVPGRDELGQLARTFNVLIDVLRQRERERNRPPRPASPPTTPPSPSAGKD